MIIIPGRSIVILSAINDLIGDQRLHKVATSLQKAGFCPILVGLKFRTSKKTLDRNYRVRRLSMFFRKGPFFYAEFNVRLFFFLLFTKSQIIVANDLDTLLANYLAYWIKRIFSKKISLVYDSHELFTELPELNDRPNTRRVWLSIEKWILPRLKNTYTVCQPIADYYFEKYKVKMEVIRNMPTYDSSEVQIPLPDLLLPENKKIILYQGALNIGRGIEQVIDLMEYIGNAIFVISGSGSIEKSLKQRVCEKNVNDKVIFTGKLPFNQLYQLTKKADVGLVLQDDISLSYHYVLPNRLFDFIKAGVPIIASDLPEIKKIVEMENIGLIVKGLNDPELLKKIQLLLNDETLIAKLKDNIKNCSSKYYWENDEKKLLEIYLNLKSI